MKKVICLLVLMLIFSGCGGLSYNVKTTGFLNTTQGFVRLPEGASFSVLDNKQTKNPIFDREIKRKIEILLAKNGYIIESPDKAAYHLTFNYSLGSGQVITDTIPVYNPGETTYQQGTFDVNSDKGGHRYGNFSRWTTAPGYTSYVPTNYVQYNKSLTLKVIDADVLRKGQNEEVVWIGDTISSDDSSDLRNAINYLLISAFRYFGQDTGKEIRITLNAVDKEVEELRKAITLSTDDEKK